MLNAHGHAVRYIETTCVVDLDGRAANLQKSLARGLSWIERQPARTGKLAIVGSGPSVRDRLDKLKVWDGEIWAVNGAYDYLLSQGIVPDGFWGIDPLPGLAEYVKNARPETTFYIAGSCDPSVFDVLEGYKVALWFPACDDLVYPEGALQVPGGVTVLTRAPFAAYDLGWRDITLFGADSSFDDKLEWRYCYDDGTYKEDSRGELNFVQVEQGGPVFVSEATLINQVTNLGIIKGVFGDVLKFDCDGLIAAHLSAPMNEIDKDGNVIGPCTEWFYENRR